MSRTEGRRRLGEPGQLRKPVSLNVKGEEGDEVQGASKGGSPKRTEL